MVDGEVKNSTSRSASLDKSDKTSVFYWDKKEALSLLQTPGLQLPNHLPQDGFIHSIDENGANVNKNKTLKLFSDIGLELPERLNSLGFDTIIHQSRNVVNTNMRLKTLVLRLFSYLMQSIFHSNCKPFRTVAFTLRIYGHNTPTEKPLSVSRKQKAQEAVSRYRESGDERDLPDKGWARSYVRDTRNRSRYKNHLTFFAISRK